jgi:hypothetical protein
MGDEDRLAAELAALEERIGSLRQLGRVRGQVAAELARVRADLRQRAARRAPIRLDDLRVAAPCTQRWDDMVGDDRVRVCGACARPVFDLSAMTAADAEAVLATRGAAPCVRFYQRGDGRVKTSDCPDGAPLSRGALAAAAVVLAAGAAAATLAPTPRADADTAAPEACDLDEAAALGGEADGGEARPTRPRWRSRMGMAIRRPPREAM